MLQRHPRAKVPFCEVLLNLSEFSKLRLWCQNKCLYLNKGNETESQIRLLWMDLEPIIWSKVSQKEKTNTVY